jgi:hypothetical protein
VRALPLSHLHTRQVRALYLAYKLMLHMAGIIAERSGTVILPADLSSTSRASPAKTGRRFA